MTNKDTRAKVIRDFQQKLWEVWHQIEMEFPTIPFSDQELMKATNLTYSESIFFLNIFTGLYLLKWNGAAIWKINQEGKENEL